MLIRKETTLQICYLLIPKYIQFNYHKMTKVRSLKRNVLFHNAMCSRFIDLRRVIHINYTFFHHLNPAKWNLDLFEPIVISYIFQFYYSCGSQTFCNFLIFSIWLFFENLFSAIMPGKFNFYHSAFLACFISVTNVLFSISSWRWSFLMLIIKMSVSAFWLSSMRCITRQFRLEY